MAFLQEVAKFASGAVAFHAVVHTVLLFSGINLTILGITQTPALHIVAIVLSALISFALAMYGWRLLPLGLSTLGADKSRRQFASASKTRS